MMWQDIIITIANLLFTYALFPQVYYGFKRKKGTITFQTGLLTFIGLYAMAFAFFTINLAFSAVVSSVNGTLWLILFIQRIMYGIK